MPGKKFLLFGFLIILVFTMGCETARGFRQDAKNIWSHLQHADEWVKKNLW